MNEIIFERISDGAKFIPSFPECNVDYESTLEMWTDFFKGKTSFYFKEVKWIGRKWYQFKGKWTETGSIWKPTSDEFNILKRHGV